MTEAAISIIGYIRDRRRTNSVAARRGGDGAASECGETDRSARVIDFVTRRDATPADPSTFPIIEDSAAHAASKPVLVRGSPEWSRRVGELMQQDRIEDFETLCRLMGVGACKDPPRRD